MHLLEQVRALVGREVVLIAVAFTGRCSSKVGVRTEESLKHVVFLFHPHGVMERKLENSYVFSWRLAMLQAVLGCIGHHSTHQRS